MRNRPLEVVTNNDSLDHFTHSYGATWSRGSYSLGHYELVTMEHAVGVTIRHFVFLHVHLASKFEAPGNSGVSASKQLFWVLNDELCPRLKLVGDQVFLRCQVTVAVSVSIRIRAAITQVGEQVPFIVVRT